MTDIEKDKYYDDVIAPALLEVQNKCQDAGMPFIAAVWITPESWGETGYVPTDCRSAYIRTVQASVKAKGNADSLIAWMMKHGLEHGHNSAYLLLLETKGN